MSDFDHEMAARYQHQAEEWRKTGGNAFPIPAERGPNGEGIIDASPGLTVRDYFAVHADQPGVAEIVSHAGFTYSNNQVWRDSNTSLGTFNDWWRDMPNSERLRLSAEVRYAMADAMIAARLPSTPGATPCDGRGE